MRSLKNTFEYGLSTRKREFTVRFSLLIASLVFVTGCAISMSMTPREFMEKFPHATKAEFYTLTDAHDAEMRGTCRVLVKNRSYAAPLGLTVDGDLENGARGVDEWIYSDGGNAFILRDFEWIYVPGGTQLIVYFDTMICGDAHEETSKPIGA